MIDDNVLAAVLAGGKSQRFGSNKSEVMLNGKKLIDYTLDKLNKNFNNIIIVSNEVEYDGYQTIRDCLEGNLGPLVGVLSAMKWALKNNKKIKWIATFPCDTPFFKTSILDKFLKALEQNSSKLYFAKTSDKRHNIFGFWSLELLEKLEEDLTTNSIRKVEVWADKVGVEIINFKDENYDSFFNINSKEDLKKAEEMIKIIKND